MATITAAIVLGENGFLTDASSVAVTALDVLKENNYKIDSSTASVTAQNILDENQYTTAECSLINLEYLIDNTVNYLNLNANTNIPPMQGTAGAKTLTCTRTEASAVKLGAALMLRARQDRGPNVGIGGLSVSTVVNDPQYQLFSEAFKTAASHLQILSASNVELLIEIAVGYVNASTSAGLSMLSGVSGNKTASYPSAQASIVKLIAGTLLRVSLSRGATSGLTVQNVVADPEHTLIAEMIKTAVERTRTLNPVNVEYIIDNAINTVNLHAGTSITNLSGTAGSKSTSTTNNQAAVVKLFAGEFLKAAIEGRKTNQAILDLALSGAAQLQEPEWGNAII